MNNCQNLYLFMFFRRYENNDNLYYTNKQSLPMKDTFLSAWTREASSGFRIMQMVAVSITL